MKGSMEERQRLSNSHEEMKRPFEIRGSLLVRNALLNLVGQAVSLVVGVVTIPFIVRGLGIERFGLLSLIWVILGYFTIFDLGLGRATIKFVAEALGKGQHEEIPRLVWTAVTAQAALGVAGALALAGMTPLLVGRILNIPPDLAEEAKATFYLLALAVPAILVSGSFLGVLEAAQRFDLVNAVKISSNTVVLLISLVGSLRGQNLSEIIGYILLAKLGFLAIFVVLSVHIFPELIRFTISFVCLRKLFAFGGWVVISNIFAPFLMNIDRFMIGSLLSMTTVAYYSAPYEAITRLAIIPASITTVLFPAFSVLKLIQDEQSLSTIFARSIKQVLLVVGAIVILIWVFAYDILDLWLGMDFALTSNWVFRFLSLSILFNSLGYIPSAVLQGIGRPDLPAKFHLLEFPVRIGISWLLISIWGITGGALSWCVWAVLDSSLLFLAVFMVCKFSLGLFVENGIIRTLFSLALLAGGLFLLKQFAHHVPLVIQGLIVLLYIGLFIWLSWLFVLDDLDRKEIIRGVKLWEKASSAPQKV